MKRKDLAEQLEKLAANIASDGFTFDDALDASDDLRGHAYEVENLEDYHWVDEDED